MSDAIQEFDVVVLGGGPGGYVAAIRSAQLGLKTCIVDEQPLGGVCVNWGCIPTKALLKTAELYQNLKHLSDFGLQVDVNEISWKRVIQRSREISAKNSAGVEYLVKKNGIQRLTGHFRVVADHEIEIESSDNHATILDRVRGKHVIIATGSRNRMIQGIAPDGKQIITFREAMLLDSQPESLVVIGAGAIGVEFAFFYATLGTKVTILEMLPRILPLEDAESSQYIARLFKRKGIDCQVSTRVETLMGQGSSVQITAMGEKGIQSYIAEKCLVAIGFAANLEDWGFEKTRIELEKGYIKVDEFYRTSIPGCYAIGDVIGPPQLAHVASHEGIICIESIAGQKPQTLDYTSIPSCVYCQPQVASVGLTEEQCRATGIEVKIGKFPFSASGKANATGETDGFVKLIFSATDNRLLGAHIVGTEATEMIAELTIAKTLNATAEDLIRTIHAHPTLSEAVMEAAAVAQGHAIHYLGKT